MNRQPASGFTLIELLVVVAIIALLVSILMPSLGRAKDLARQAVCASQLHEIGLAAHMYGSATGGALPMVPRMHHGGNGTGQVDPFESYVAYWDEFEAPGDLRPINLGALHAMEAVSNPRVFYCPLQTEGPRSYSWPRKPWGSTTASDQRPDEWYIRTGYLFLPYGYGRRGDPGPPHPQRLVKADQSLILAADDMLHPTSPHGHYWNVAHMDGAVQAAEGEHLGDWLAPDQSLGNDWENFAPFRDEISIAAR